MKMIRVFGLLLLTVRVIRTEIVAWKYLTVALLLAGSVGQAETAYWSDNFETNANSHWSVNGVWHITAPTAGPPTNSAGYRTYSGSHCGTTQNYATLVASSLICTNYNGSSTLLVPATNQFPRLRFWHWFNLANAVGFVEITTNNGSSWSQISPTYTYASSASGDFTSSGVWSRPYLDLSAFAGMHVQFAFSFEGGPSPNGLGWDVDDVAVVTGTPVYNEPESFASGEGDWSVDQGTWEVGVPTSGPNAAYSGSNCAATVLAGNYAAYANSRLISPPFTVSTVTTPTLTFWQWYNLNDAEAVVEITTNKGISWNPISTTWGPTAVSGGWLQTSINLSSYAGQSVAVGFSFGAGGISTAPGWYVDAITLPVDPLPIIALANSGAYASQVQSNIYSGQILLNRSGGLSQSVTVNLVTSGTATPGVDYPPLPTSVTLAAYQTSTNFLVLSTNSNLTIAKTVVLSLINGSSYFPGLTTNATVTLIPNSSITNPVISTIGRYYRGSGGNPTYWSMVVPLDNETGTMYSNLNGNCTTLYPGLTSWSAQTNFHYNAANSLPQTFATNRIPFNNPIVAFGEHGGGTPLYINQEYNFGFYAGDPAATNQLVIQAYYRTNYQLAGTIKMYPPTASTTNLEAFDTNGWQFTTNGFGLTTIMSSAPYLSWGEILAGSYLSGLNGAYVLTHLASSQASNYYYVVSVAGSVNSLTNAMVINSNGQWSASLLYSMDFEQRPPWRAVFLDQPHFGGQPLPPFYAGKTLAEMLTNTPTVTNIVSFSPSAATNLDDSPELWRHPMLDNFVASMGNDPIALANYVINQIDLTDPLDNNDDGSVTETSINPPGVTRGALATFMEKQGSPVEECALLVYLLRQAGVPAVYEFAPHNGLQILDARLSQMLKFQVHGDINSAGELYTTNAMIPVNYPWVAAYIGTNWVHIFPWLKDYEMNEGLDLWEEMPTNYCNAFMWIHDYIYGNTNLLSLAADGDNTPRAIFPNYVQQTLLKNYPGVSMGDIGIEIVNRRHYYARWQDFPTPTWVTNVSTAIESLSSSTLTNVNPALTNAFDTMSVEIYSQANPQEDIKTGDMPLVALHDREFYIRQFITNGNVQLNLVLMPFSTNVTTTMAFTNDPNLLSKSKELLSLGFTPLDNELGVRFRYHRHRAITPATPIDPFVNFLSLSGYNEVDVERPLFVGDQAAICMDYGRVSPEMINFHMANLWQMENALSANPALTNTLSCDIYEGEVMYLAGLSYYEKCDEFDQVDQQLQKYDQLSLFGVGLSKIIPGRNSSGSLTNGTDPIIPTVDMAFYQTMVAGNGTTHPNSAQDITMANENFSLMEIVNRSAEEHQVLNRFYQQTNAVSTVRLLQLAQSSGAGIAEVDVFNFVTQGLKSYQGEALASWDNNIWQQVENNLGSGLSLAYMTPGPISNGVYRGMGALILNPLSGYYALISPANINGGFSGEEFQPGTFSSENAVNYNVEDDNGDPTVSFNLPANQTTLVPGEITSYDLATAASQISSGEDVADSFTTNMAGAISSQLGTASGYSGSAVGQDVLAAQQNGYLGTPDDAGSQSGTQVSDPVHNITGEFYVNETDLQLPGPIPLALSRNYSSQNLANNQFGYGWKLNIMPYLSLSSGSTTIYAADMDGAVLAYVHSTNSASTNLWTPTLAANPLLVNNTTAGAGGVVNRLRDYILSSVNGSVTNYTLYGADGSVRVFQFMNFNSGTITNARPYLIQWTDSRGNYYTFAYDTNSSDVNFGQMERIQCSNGNYLGFDYDVYGHIVDAYTGDTRWMYYAYDEYGDLESVTLADGTTRSYQYQHATQAVTNGLATYSTHLIIEEDKPDGRVLQNAYDSQRRVTNQLSTAGSSLTPIRTATFVYSNNFILTNSYTNTITGYTLVIDGNNHTNRYDYTNNLITKITDPLGQTIQQVWFTTNTNAAGYYPQSVQQRADKRGLISQYQYDANGNVTNTIRIGDLTGNGITSQTATNTAVYNTNCLPVQMTDPSGNSTLVIYDPVFTFLPQQTIRYAGGTYVFTNYTIYGNATNVIINGSVTQTNLAFGLPIRQIRAYGSPDAATNDVSYDGNGFPIQTIRYTGTGDPNVANTFFYNERGQMVNQVDALGAVTFFDYDALNRPIEQENFDEFGNVLSWNFNYYNDNGELNWTEGPRYNPENYVYYDYDGAGRVTTEIHWRSEANNAGTGVEAPAGYNLYSQSFYQYDVLGNLTLAVDPRGAMTTNRWDALCRLVQRTHLDTNEVTVLSTEGFSYEPGGQVQGYTNALGGVSTTLYTITGKPEYRSNPDGSTNAWRYYLDGRIYQEIQGNGAYWQTTYDDAHRITTRIFYSAAHLPEATNSTQLDRRGNVIEQVDAGGNAFISQYDGLDRVKTTAGPAIVTVSQSENLNFQMVYQTNTIQQASTNYFDAAGRVVTNVNALGETTITAMDALGRTTSNLVYSASGTLVREKYFAYSADHNSVTVTDGSGASAISHTTWTDTSGHAVLSIAYPSASTTEFTLNQFDLAGNLVSSQHNSSVNGNISTWTTSSQNYDGLNRPIRTVDRDGAITTYAYDALGDVTNRTMPGGLQWVATYANSGLELQDWLVGAGNVGTRTNTYAYYSVGSPFAGLVNTKTDGRGLVSAYAYDDWLRTISVTRADPNYNYVTTSLGYDARGYATNITEQYAANDVTNSNPKTVLRAFDPYGQLSSETVTVGGLVFSSASLTWDSAGRRTGLIINDAGYAFASRADGALICASATNGSGSYAYDTAGLLTNRAVGVRATSVTSRDGEGRPNTITTSISGTMQLTEALAWNGDGTLYSDTLYRPDFTDARLYSYANLSRRLTQEQLNLNGATVWTNSFAYDGGSAGGPGVLTSAGQPGSAQWSGGVSAFSAISAETNNAVAYPAYGRANGQSAISASLDGKPVSVTTNSTSDSSRPLRWYTTMEMTPGTHQLTVAAAHPSGLYTAWATNWFTNSIGGQSVAIARDGSGNVMQRIWRDPNGANVHQQTLYFDGKDRPADIYDLDGTQSGYYLHSEYDGLNRRLYSICTVYTNGQALSGSQLVINQYYDPMVEFLELGVSYGTKTEWKLYGPDANGQYGGLNGTGGLDGVSPYLNLFNSLISDFRGDILGEVTNNMVTWNPARPTGYGAVPGYRPVALGHGADISLASAWHGRWVDITGCYQIGMRTYDPVAGMWLSFDSAWNEIDPNGFSMCGGDPINGFDPDGRMSRLDYQIQNLGQNYEALASASPNNFSAADFYNQSSDFKNVLGTFFPGQSWGDFDESQRLFAISLMTGGQPNYSFTDAAASANYYNQMSANGLNKGGVGGYADFAAGQVGEDLLDVFGTTSVQQSAEQSGDASADPSRQGAAWGYGALTVGTIAMNAIPGEGKATSVVEEEGEKLLTAKAAENGVIAKKTPWTSSNRARGWREKGYPEGKAPQREVIVQNRKTGEIETRVESKELHHREPRRNGGSNDAGNLQEVWPPEHETIDPYRNLDYDVLGEIPPDAYTD